MYCNRTVKHKGFIEFSKIMKLTHFHLLNLLKINIFIAYIFFYFSKSILIAL